MQGHTVSSWWEFDFSIVGKAELIENVKAEIFAARAEDEQPFFDYLHLVHEAAGFLVVHAGRNYGGCDPLLDLAEKYPIWPSPAMSSTRTSLWTAVILLSVR